MPNFPENTARSIKFQNGKLKVMHITDTHMEDDNIDYSLVLITHACDIEKPHIAIVTGDNVLNYDDAEKTKYYKECLTILNESAANVYIQDLAEFVAINKKYAGYEFYPLYVQDISKLYIVE